MSKRKYTADEWQELLDSNNDELVEVESGLFGLEHYYGGIDLYKLGNDYILVTTSEGTSSEIAAVTISDELAHAIFNELQWEKKL
jgi:hypothetical protein